MWEKKRSRCTRAAPSLCALVLACGSDGAADGDVAFSAVQVREISATRAVATFLTSRPTSCEALFGVGPAALDRSATDPNMAPGEITTDHEVALEDLSPRTHYYWRARAVDEFGEVFLSRVHEFDTNAANAAGFSEAENVALIAAGARITGVSSNFGSGDNDSRWGASKAIDGQMATEWSSDGDGDGAWLEIELSQPTVLTGFGFRSREMPDGTSIVERVQLRLDGDAAGGGLVLGPFDTPSPSERYTFPLTPGVSTTRVRVEAVQTTGGNTGAREIQLFSDSQ